MDEICRRSARFILSCLHSSSNLVQSLVWHGAVHAKYSSFFFFFSLFCCNRFGWSIDDFISDNVDRSLTFFEQYFQSVLTEEDITMTMTLFERVCLRENFSVFVPNTNFLNKKEIEYMIKFISTN